MHFLPSLLRARRATSSPHVRSFMPLAASVAIFLGSLGLTAGAAYGARSAIQSEMASRFQAQVDRLRSELHRRMLVAENVLAGTRATLAITEDLDAHQFRAYVEDRELIRFFPGMRGIGVIEQVQPQQLEAFAARQRSQGRAGFTVRASDEPGPLLVVRYAEPLDTQSRQIGEDVRRHPAWREAAQQALATGRVTLSAPITAEEGGMGPLTWLVMMPSRRSEPGTEETPVRLVYAVLDGQEVMRRLTDFLGPWVDFQLLDDASVVGSRSPVLFDSRGSLGGRSPPTGALRGEHRLRVGDRELSLRVAASRAIEMAPGQKLPSVIALGGLLLSAVLAFAAWLLMSSQDRARRLASEMTIDLGRMARVVERTSSAVFGLDLDGSITWANAGFERLTGLDAGECVGRMATTLPEIAGIDPPSRRELQVAIGRREARRFELQNQMRDGVRYWTDTELQPTRDRDGHINGFICIATDITRRKLAELRLRDSEHLMRIIADNLPGRVAYWDRERRCRFVNRRFCEVFKRSPRELLGQPLTADIFGEDLFARLVPHVDRVLQGEPQHFEQQVIDETGHTTTWQLHYIPDTEGGEVRGFFVLGLDVSELRQARDVAVRASQAKSRFLSSMSHEIRTPLNAVMGMLSLMGQTALDQRQRDYTDKADRAARSLLALLNDILDLAKIEAGKMSLVPRTFAVDDLLRDLSVIFAANVGRKDIELLFDCDPAVPMHLVADDLRLRQVLINLGGNAIKFTEQGEVVLRLELLQRVGDKARLRVSVRDTGIGLTPEAQARIFNDFVQGSDSTAREFGGTGLGLGICRKLLELMGSELQVSSEYGLGSRFWFELDLAVPEPDAIPASASAPAAGEAHRSVLIVDDNPEARESLASMARSLGWTADLAASGAEALERIAAPEGAGYDAVFIDWRMPDMDGWQASHHIRQLPGGGSAPLIVMVTGYGREMLSERPTAEQALLDGFLVKPVTASMLADALLRGQATGTGRASLPVDAGERSLPLAGLRLLVVEDNLTNQQVAQELLEAKGAQVELANDGLHGLEVIRERGDGFDAVLMDVMMPVMDGHAAARAVREQLGNWRLPIVAMTANAMESDRVDSLAAGMNDHVGKPFSIEELVQTLLRHVRQPGRPDGAGAQATGRGDLDDLPDRGSFADSAPVLLEDDATPVLDRAAAIERLGGDSALYVRLVPSFAESLQGIAARLPTLLHSVPQAEAVRLMHTLKGSASTMGADRLSRVAAEAERCLAQDPRALDVQGAGRLREVAVAIDQTLAVLGDAGSEQTQMQRQTQTQMQMQTQALLR